MAAEFRHSLLHLLRGHWLSLDRNRLSPFFLNESFLLIFSHLARLSFEGGERSLLVWGLKDIVNKFNRVLVSHTVIDRLYWLHHISSVRISNVLNLVGTMRCSHRLTHGVLTLPGVILLLDQSGSRGLMLLARVEFTHHLVETISLSIFSFPELIFRVGCSGVVQLIKLGF